MWRSNMGRWVGVSVLVGFLGVGCAHTPPTGTRGTPGPAAGTEDITFVLQLAPVIITGNAATVLPTIRLRSGRQLAIWGLVGQVERGDDLEVLFKDPNFKTRVQLHCEWRICAMHVPPELAQPGVPETYEYKIRITRKDKPPIDIDPQVEVIDF